MRRERLVRRAQRTDPRRWYEVINAETTHTMTRPRRDPDHEIWDAETENENPEPLSRGEEARLDNAYEQAMWGDQ